MPIDLAALPPAIRAFVAIRLARESEDAIARLIDSVRDRASGVRWIAPTKLHLTLCFLGPAAPAERITELDGAIGGITAAYAPFDIVARGAGAFPNLRRPRVIWIGIEATGLAELAECIAAAARSVGFEIEHKPFEPHLTIGRVRGAIRDWARAREILEAGSAAGFGISRVERVMLYRSMPGPAGSEYHELESYRLAGG